MLININVYVEINPPSPRFDYVFLINGQSVKYKIINEFDDVTGGHIYECLVTADVVDPSLGNQLSLKVDDIPQGSFIQIRELFLDDIKMDHVLLLASQLKIDQTVSGTQLQQPGEILVAFDMPIWSWWCKNLRSIEVIENVGWKVRNYE